VPVTIERHRACRIAPAASRLPHRGLSMPYCGSGRFILAAPCTNVTPLAPSRTRR
jgi:hypothetical protein